MLRRLALGAVLLAIAAWLAVRLSRDARLAFHDLLDLDPAPLALGVLLWIASQSFHGWRWRGLVPGGTAIPMPRAAAWGVGMNMIGYAIPGPLGELAVAYAARKAAGIPLRAGFAASIYGRVVALAVLAAAFALLLPRVIATTGLPPALRLLLVPVSGIALLCALVLRWPRVPIGLVRSVATRLPLGRFAARIAGLVDEFEAGVAALGASGPGPWVRAVLWSALGLVSQACAVALAWGAAGIHLPLDLLLFTHVSVSLAALAAFILPAGLGATDAVMVTLLVSLSGLPLGTAVVADLVVRGLRVVVGVLGMPAAAYLLRWAGAQRA
jgi:hypothetical protein